MIKREEIAGVRIDNCSLAGALRRLDKYLNNDCLNVVELIQTKTIVAAGEDEEVRNCLAQMDLVLPSDKEILQELGITSGQWLRDVEENRLFHDFLMKVQKQDCSMYLLAQTKEEMGFLMDFLEHCCDEKLNICGNCIFEEHSDDIENVVNEINANAPHVVLSMLPTPMQEHFIYQHRQMLNTKLWFGIGEENTSLVQRNHPKEIFGRALTRHKMKRQIQSYETED
jgi:N-acetylglucosaminyldiphosphoundecaprenol N-acetyl-beta-D-mannosaminyltransferase